VEISEAGGLEIRDTAGWKPALQSGEWAARTDTPKRSVFVNYRADDSCSSGREPAPSDQSRLTSAATGDQATLQIAIDLAIARSFLHRFLAKAFEDPTPEGWAWLCDANTQESLGFAWNVASARSTGFQPAVSPTSSRQGVNEVKSLENSEHLRIGNPRYSRLEVCATFTAAAQDSFLDAYIATFGHAARGGCPLNEIEYGDIKADPLFQPHRLADLAAFYRAFGLEVAESAGERHDHICLELEFMCVLAAKEAYALEHQLDTDQLAQCRDAQKNFLREHLGRWTPAFTRRLAGTTSEPTLVALSELTRAFVETECAHFGVKPGSEDLLLRPVDEAAESMCASCGLTQLPPGALTTA
jgi:DMSO reductase family type II enzyme chaperone